MSAENTVFRYAIPVIKATLDADNGSILHAGIASDSSLDLQGDVMDQDDVAKSYSYLESHGKFVWDHHNEDIGDIRGARQIGEDEAWERFGIKIEKSGTALWGDIYRLVGGDLDSQDLKTAHHRMRSGARLAYSLDGVCIRKSNGEIERTLLSKTAICPQPINASSWCGVITKSLSAVADQIGISDEPLPEILSELPGPPTILIDGGGTDGVRLQRDRVAMSAAVFKALVRKAFGPRNAPPPGKLPKALLDDLRLQHPSGLAKALMRRLKGR